MFHPHACQRFVAPPISSGLVRTKGSQHLAHGMPGATGLIQVNIGNISWSIPYVAGGTAKLILSCLAYFMRYIYIYSDIYIYNLPWWKPLNLQGFRCATKSLSILAGSLKTEPCRSFSVSDPTDGRQDMPRWCASFEHEHFFASPPSHWKLIIPCGCGRVLTVNNSYPNTALYNP